MARALDPHALDAESLRARSLGEASSLVAAIPDVRAALLEIQRAFAAQAGGAVIDGRDIGTVICPAADVKLFVTAAAAVRAERRHRELLARGEQAEYAAVLADIERRDARVPHGLFRGPVPRHRRAEHDLRGHHCVDDQ